jgi:uncharacterized protein (TIGR03067 family)
MCRRLIVLLLAAAFIPAHALASEKEDLDQLQGDWRKVQFELSGTPGDIDQQPSLRIRDSKVVTLQNGKEVDGLELTLKLDPTTTPKLLDVVLPDGQTLEGIYKLEEGRWTICLHTDPGVKNRPTTFESPPDSKLILAVFEKGR